MRGLRRIRKKFLNWSKRHIRASRENPSTWYVWLGRRVFTRGRLGRMRTSTIHRLLQETEFQDLCGNCFNFRTQFFNLQVKFYYFRVQNTWRLSSTIVTAVATLVMAVSLMVSKTWWGGETTAVRTLIACMRGVSSGSRFCSWGSWFIRMGEISVKHLLIFSFLKDFNPSP